MHWSRAGHRGDAVDPGVRDFELRSAYFTGRAWDVGDNFLCYAMYGALAEAIDAPLATGDGPLGGGSPGGVRIEVVR